MTDQHPPLHDQPRDLRPLTPHLAAEQAAEDDDALARPDSELAPAIAANIRRIRRERAIPSETLAHSAGLDQDLLQRIEAGEETPTIRLLWRLATALGVPFSNLVNPRLEPDQQLRRSPERLTKRAVLQSGEPDGRRTELYELTLPPGAHEPAAPGKTATLESLLVTAGRIVVSYAGQEHILSAGDTLAIPGAVPRAYENRGQTLATIYLKVSPLELG